MAPSAQTVAEAAALIEAQAQARQAITDLTKAAVAAQVRAFTGWYDHTAITALAGRLAKLTKAGQKQTAASTDAFALQILRLLVGRRLTGTKPIDVSTGLRSGVPLEGAYGRLADQFRWLEATRGAEVPESLLQRPDAKPLPRLTTDDVLNRVVERSRQQVDDNLSLAFRDQWAADLAEAQQITGYRRVIHPELTASGTSCGLCIVASTRLYFKAELLPMHTYCRCTVSPVLGDPDGDGDPGSVINAADLRDLYKRAGGTAAAGLRKTKYEVVQHGELGPRLVYAGQRHRGPVEVAADDQVPSAA